MNNDLNKDDCLQFAEDCEELKDWPLRDQFMWAWLFCWAGMPVWR